MENIKQHDHRTTRRPDCVTEIRMGNTVLVVSGFFKKDTTFTVSLSLCRVESICLLAAVNSSIVYFMFSPLTSDFFVKSEYTTEL